MGMLLFYALLALGLLSDGAVLFRMVLVCAFVHECGHAAVYVLCAHRLPKLACGGAGIRLCRTQGLSARQRLFVLCAGPAANLLMGLALFWRAQMQASYALYFLAAVSFCTALYNLLPFGALDGAQLLEAALPPCALGAWVRAQRVLLLAFCMALPVAAFYFCWPPAARAASVAAPVYLLAQQHLS